MIKKWKLLQSSVRVLTGSGFELWGTRFQKAEQEHTGQRVNCESFHR